MFNISQKYLYIINKCAPKFGAFSSKGALGNGLIGLSLGPALYTIYDYTYILLPSSSFFFFFLIFLFSWFFLILLIISIFTSSISKAFIYIYRQTYIHTSVFVLKKKINKFFFSFYICFFFMGHFIYVEA